MIVHLFLSRLYPVIALIILCCSFSCTHIANQAIYEEALKHGYINYRSITTVLMGVAGAGKTSVQALLFSQPPLALAKFPVKAAVCVTVDTTGDVWRTMGEDGQDQFLAQSMTTVSTSSEPANRISDDGSPQLQSLELNDPTRTSTGSKLTSTEASLFTVPTESFSQIGAFGKPTNKPSSLSTPRFTNPSEVDKKFLDLIASCSPQSKPCNVGGSHNSRRSIAVCSYASHHDICH